MSFKSQIDTFDRSRQPEPPSYQLPKQTPHQLTTNRDAAQHSIEQVHFERYEPIQSRQDERRRPQAPLSFHQSSVQQPQRTPQQRKKQESLQMAIEESLPTSSKKMKLTKLEGKLNKSLEEFFLKDGESSYVDEISMMKHYNM